MVKELSEIVKGPKTRWTIKILQLNLEAAKEGRTWLLLPDGFRAKECGKTYPLPSRGRELQVLAAIFIPRHKLDAGCIYLRRAAKKAKEWNGRRLSATLDISRRGEQIKETQRDYWKVIRDLKVDARKAVDEVREEAEKAAASLHDLFALGREGIEGQMKAHLAGEEWKDERISAAAFRDSFRMVTQAVKGLGLPSDQKPAAGQAIMDEVAKSLEATKEVIALAPTGDPGTEH